MTQERIQKILAHAGVGSRRTCEALIIEQRVRVNGVVAQIGDQADPAIDKITVDFQPIQLENSARYVMLHKPIGIVCSTESQGERNTVYDMVKSSERLYCAGRLDVDSEGLVLMTNDGELTHQLTHPSFRHEKEYHVLVRGIPDEKQLATWRRGLVLDEDERVGPCQVIVLESTTTGDTWLQVIMYEGKKRQIRRTGLMLGLPVKKLIRVRLSTLRLGGLQTGQSRELSAAEVQELRKSLIRRPNRGTHTRRPMGDKPAYGAPGARPARTESSEKRPTRPQRENTARPESPARPRRTKR